MTVDAYAESMYAMDAVRFSGEPMDRYSHLSEDSSEQVQISFCRRCGTTIALTFKRWPHLCGISRGTFEDPNSVSIGSQIWNSSAQTGVVLPAAADCFQFARADPAGAPEAPVRFDTPQLARTRND